jgi:hypothetical protein
MLKLFGAGLAAVVIVLVVLLLVRERVPDPGGVAPKLADVRCPFVYTLGGAPQGTSSDGMAAWTVFISDFHNTAPNVNVSYDAKAEAPDGGKGACKLEIAKLPGAPLAGVDWRMGVTLPPLSARGKSAKVGFQLRADKDIAFDAGQIYLYDGKVVVGAPLGVVGKEWKTLAFEHAIPADATALEVWIRLTIHGNISQKGVLHMANVTLTVN